MKSNLCKQPSIEQLKRAVEIRETIEKLEAELQAILAGKSPGAKPGGKAKAKGKRVMTAEWKAKIAAAQTARWARFRAEKKNKKN